MKVEDVIAALSMVPSDMEVLVGGYDGRFTRIESIDIRPVWNQTGGPYGDEFSTTCKEVKNDAVALLITRF